MMRLAASYQRGLNRTLSRIASTIHPEHTSISFRAVFLRVRARFWLTVLPSFAHSVNMQSTRMVAIPGLVPERGWDGNVDRLP